MGAVGGVSSGAAHGSLAFWGFVSSPPIMVPWRNVELSGARDTAAPGIVPPSATARLAEEDFAGRGFGASTSGSVSAWGSTQTFDNSGVLPTSMSRNRFAAKDAYSGSCFGMRGGLMNKRSCHVDTRLSKRPPAWLREHSGCTHRAQNVAWKSDSGTPWSLQTGKKSRRSAMNLSDDKFIQQVHPSKVTGEPRRWHQEALFRVEEHDVPLATE